MLFRRTNLTAPLPAPAAGATVADLDLLRDAGIRLPGRDFQLLVGCLVASLFVDIPHPVIALLAEQGSGKSITARLIVGITDPSSAPLRSAPRNEEHWGVQAAASWMVALDNISTITPWLSDALCRAVTGDGIVRRTLYTDSDVTVSSFKRCVVLTSIDAGAMRGDLAERLVPLELDRISPQDRRTEDDVLGVFAQHHPRILGGLFALTSQVLTVLPEVHLENLPRMADFAKILAAIDMVTGWSSLPAFLGVADQLAGDVIESDPVASAVRDLFTTVDTWSGSATDLLEALTTEDVEHRRDWPRTPRALSGRLKRAATALRAIGVDIETTRSGSTRTIHITRTENSRNDASQPSQPSRSAQPHGSISDANVDPLRHCDDFASLLASQPDPHNHADRDGNDANDARTQPTSVDDLCSRCGEQPRGSFTDLCAPCASLEARRTRR